VSIPLEGGIVTNHAHAPRRVQLHIKGRVQGVGFRAGARREGQRRGIDLTARNLVDGSVQIDAVGPTAAIDDLITWAHHGPPAARVDRVDVHELP
jgi:acylphosphatase